MQDAQNLAWKLAAVLRGEADEGLLDTYEPERRPVGQAVTHSSLLNALSMGRTSRQTQAVLPRREFLNEVGLIFGARYRSAAVITDGQPEPATDDQVQDYVPSAAPGCRAPHAWLTRDGERLSTIDLVGREFVLFTGPRGGAWREAAQHLQAPSVVTMTIGQDVQDADGTWLSLYGIDEDGAVLVRRTAMSAGARVRAPLTQAPPCAGHWIRCSVATEPRCQYDGGNHCDPPLHVGCAPGDLPVLLAFYTDVLGLQEGYRPKLRNPGHWLYADGQAIVHLNALLASTPPPGSGPLDHVALKAHGLDATREFLRARNIPFSESPLTGTTLHQVFLADPLGLTIELNFDTQAEKAEVSLMSVCATEPAAEIRAAWQSFKRFTCAAGAGNRDGAVAEYPAGNTLIDPDTLYLAQHQLQRVAPNQADLDQHPLIRHREFGGLHHDPAGNEHHDPDYHQTHAHPPDCSTADGSTTVVQRKCHDPGGEQQDRGK